MTPAIELRGVTKRFGTVEALTGVDLVVQPGEVVALLGPNGAGKTTALAIMLGLRQPTTGEARLFGLRPDDPRARRRVGVMLQESGVPGLLTVAELVDLFRSYYPAPLPAARVLAEAHLEGKRDARVGELSGGQKQRLYFALALCGDPEVLFLDEPTVAMDVESRRAFLASLRRHADAGRTLVLTTHYLEEADALARRVVVVDRGRVVADASPAEIKARVPGRRIRLRAALTPADLAGLPAQAVDIAGTEVRMLSTDPEAVLRGLWERGVAFTGLEVAGADLEEAFLAITHEVHA